MAQYNNLESVSDAQLASEPLGDVREALNESSDKKIRNDSGEGPSFNYLRLPLILASSSMAVLYPTADQISSHLSLVNMNASFDVNMSISQWVMLSFESFSAIMVAFADRLGSRFGKDLIFKVGMVMLAVANLVICVSPKIYLVMVARCFTGTGLATVSSSYAVIQKAVTRPDKFNRMIMVQTFSMASVNIIFPLITGAINDLGENAWRGNYFIFFIVTTASAVLSFMKVPRLPRVADIRFDVPGFACLFPMVASIIIFFSSFSFGWPWYASAGLATCFVVSLVLFIIVERRPPGSARTARAPPALIPVTELSDRNTVIFFLNVMVVLGAFSANTYLVPYLATIVFEFDSFITSLFIVCVSVGMATFSATCGRFVKRVTSRLLFAAAVMLIALGLLGQTVSAIVRVYPATMAFLFMCGFGIGLFTACQMGFIFKVAGRNLGLYGGLITTFTMIGRAMFTSIASAGLNIALNIMTTRAGYASLKEVEPEEYKRYYAIAVGVMMAFFGIIAFVCSFSMFAMRPIATERGQIGFSERRLEKNTAQTAAVGEDAGMVKVHEAEMNGLLNSRETELFLRSIDSF
eukprot:gnl/Chilomastix_cuspidata/1555.p1 GENE.gnl/Chilomastix_cuspidata/1555~~gnl/Chilomastix_cuspidata/1555.p1  ORF type:complete len:579 (+),score=204.05 gnl/Chilomastix_cuspidata/1555:48-1784(+)